MNQPIRVFVINDHRLFSDVVTLMLAQQEGIAFVGAASELEEMESTSNSMPCDVVLVNATMQNLDAARVTLEIKSEFPDIKVIMLGVEPREEDILRFIEAGATGYISQQSSFADLLHTIKAVHHGQTLCSPRITALVFARIAELSHQRSRLQDVPEVRLTPREHEVLQLLASGYRNSEIGEQLGIALHTVKSHVHNLLEKLHACGRREAIQRAYAHGLLHGVGPYPSSRMPGASSLA